jgi:hypothetical protein
MSFESDLRAAAARALEVIRRAALAQREKELERKARKAWVRKARQQAGGLCGVTTKVGKPCRRKACASGQCATHGGLNAGELWDQMEGSPTPRLPQGSPKSEAMRKDAVFLPTTRMRARETKKV